MNIGDIIPKQFDTVLVGLSYFIAVLGSYVALECTVRIPQPDGRARLGFVIGGAVALGGVAIWSMHFIGMTALQTAIDVEYQVLPTFVSLVAAIVVSALALWFVGTGAFTFGKLLISGVLTGIGVAVMHYLGMSAMQMGASLRWDMAIVAISVVIAIVAATVALWLAFNLRRSWQRSIAALVMGAAVTGMHYTGMAAGTLVCAAAATNGSSALGGNDLSMIVFAIALMILGAIVVYAILNWEPDYAAEAS